MDTTTLELIKENKRMIDLYNHLLEMQLNNSQKRLLISVGNAIQARAEYCTQFWNKCSDSLRNDESLPGP